MNVIFVNLGGSVSVLVVFSIALPGPSVSPSDRHSEGRAVRGAADPRGVHVQGRGQRAVLPTVRAAQDCREP